MATMHKAVREGMRTEALRWLSEQLRWEHALDRLRTDVKPSGGALRHAA